MRKALLALAVAGLGITPAYAVDVLFTGNITGVCSLALSTPGTLAVSTDGQTLGSQEGLGLFAAVTVLSIGNATVTVAAPTRTQSPAGYVATGETVEVAYTGLSGLSGISHPTYTNQQTTFAANSLPLTVLQLNNRIRNVNGFPTGTYQTRTVVTCS